MRAMMSPFFTDAPSLTFSSTSFPGTLKEMSTWVSSMLPETVRRLSRGRKSRPDHSTPATAARMTSKRMGITILRFMLVLMDHALNGSSGRREIDASDVVVVERADAIVERALKSSLRIRDFDAVGDAGLIAALRLGQFVLRELQSFFGGFHLGVGGAQAVERQPHIQLDLIAQIAGADLFLAIERGAFGAPRIAAAAVENPNSERCSVCARWNGVVNTCTDGSVIGEACERRQALELRGAVVEFCALLAALLGFEFGAIFARGVERLRDIRRIGRSVGESVGQLDWILEL